MRAEFLCGVLLRVASEHDGYEPLPMHPAVLVRLMMLQIDDRQLSTPTVPVNLYGAGLWLQCAGDVPNDQRVVMKPPLLEEPVHYTLTGTVDVQVPLSVSKLKYQNRSILFDSLLSTSFLLYFEILAFFGGGI